MIKLAIIDRKLNAKRNIITGFLLKMYKLLIPFFMRSAVIYYLGIQYLGLASLFTSLLQVLNLAELGVGAAMVFSMYEPIVKDDDEKICALLKLYKYYYRIIGSVICGVGVIVSPFIPRLIAGDVPSDINIYVLYYMNLGVTVLSYWLFSYRNSIFNAYQRIDILMIVDMICSTLQYIGQLFVLIWLKNYYLFFGVTIITGIISNLSVAWLSTKYYPQYSARGDLGIIEKKKLNSRIRDYFTSRIGGVVYNYVDAIVISAYLGLTKLAIYQNYFMILTVLTEMVNIILNACMAGIGNSLVKESKEKNYRDLVLLSFITCWISGVFVSCMICLYQPFMQAWMGEEFLFDFKVVICFVVYFFVRQINSVLNLYKNAAGIWHEDRYRPLCAAGINLMLNLFLVRYIGVYGVILSTVLAILVVGEPWLIHNLFMLIFDAKNMKEYIYKLLLYSFLAAFGCFICYFLVIGIHFNSIIIELVVKGVICVGIADIVLFLGLRREEEFNRSIALIKSMIKI